MQCIRCKYNKGGGYFTASDGLVCESCADKDPEIQFQAIVIQLFCVPYEQLAKPARKFINDTIVRFGFSMESIQADVKRSNDEYLTWCQKEAPPFEGPTEWYPVAPRFTAPG